MELTGDLKKQVEQAESKEEKKRIIEKAGILLTDEEVDDVSGGHGRNVRPQCSDPWTVDSNVQYGEIF